MTTKQIGGLSVMVLAMAAVGCAAEAGGDFDRDVERVGETHQAVEPGTITARIDRLPRFGTATIPVETCGEPSAAMQEAMGTMKKAWSDPSSAATTSVRFVQQVGVVEVRETHASMRFTTLSIPAGGSGAPMSIGVADAAPAVPTITTGTLSAGPFDNVCGKSKPPPPPPPPPPSGGSNRDYLLDLDGVKGESKRVEPLVFDLVAHRVSPLVVTLEGDDAVAIGRVARVGATIDVIPSTAEAASVHVHDIVVTKIEVAPATRTTPATTTLWASVGSAELVLGEAAANNQDTIATTTIESY